MILDNVSYVVVKEDSSGNYYEQTMKGSFLKVTLRQTSNIVSWKKA